MDMGMLFSVVVLAVWLPGAVKSVVAAQAIPNSAVPTQSGYLSVTATSRLFYYFYEASHPVGPISETPIIFFFAGKDGCSSMTGNFEEVGPWRIDENQEFSENSYPWNRLFGVLFVDNPIGTGFSIAPSLADIPITKEEQNRHLYIALVSFFTNSKFEYRPLYIAGAARYVLSLAYYIRLRETETSSGVLLSKTTASLPPPPFSVKGVAIFGSTDPVLQTKAFAPTAYYFGHIDERQRDYIDSLADKVLEYGEQGRYDLALDLRNKITGELYIASGLAAVGDITRTSAYFLNADGSDFLTPLLNNNAVKQAIGADLDQVYINCNLDIRALFQNLTMQSTVWLVDALLPHIPVLFYAGQFDIEDGAAAGDLWMKSLTWSGMASFYAQPRKIMRIGEDLVGYVRRFEALTYLVMVGGGHHLAADQPIRAQKMIEDWIAGTLGNL